MKICVAIVLLAAVVCAGRHKGWEKKTHTKVATKVAVNAPDCGKPAVAPATMFIVGGVRARKNSWPWMARLNYYGSHRCGGSLVNADTIVTAAHCVKGTRARNWEVVLGDHAENKKELTEITRSVSRVIYHPSYNARTVDYDIAILKLSSSVNFTDAVSPVCLPIGQTFVDDDTAFTTGWGALTSGGSSPNKLMQVHVPIISTSVCESNTSYTRSEITSRMICAGYIDGGKDACQGDSGGPLVVEKEGIWQLAGVVSWGYGCADAGYPGVYAKTTKFLDYIAQYL